MSYRVNRHVIFHVSYFGNAPDIDITDVILIMHKPDLGE